MREQILLEKIFVWHCFVMDINGCENNPSLSWREGCLTFQTTAAKLWRKNCHVEKTPIRLLKTQKKERNQILQKSKSGKEIFWSHLERQLQR